MKRILALGTATILALQPVFAAPNKHHQQHHRKHPPAAAVHRHSQKVPKAVAKHFQGNGGKHAQFRHKGSQGSVTHQKNQHLKSIARQHWIKNHKGSVARHQADKFQQRLAERRKWQKNHSNIAKHWGDQHRDWNKHHGPTFAFGGHRRHFRPPINIYQHWDRHTTYVWNNHHYRWNHGAWVIFAPQYESLYYSMVPYPYELSLGSSVVFSVQKALFDEGYDPGLIDGVIGPTTRAAIGVYQDDNGLVVNGRIDQELLRSLGLLDLTLG